MTHLPCVMLGGGLEALPEAGGSGASDSQLSSCWWNAPQRWDGYHRPGDGCFSPEMGVTSSRQVSQP